MAGKRSPKEAQLNKVSPEATFQDLSFIVSNGKLSYKIHEKETIWILKFFIIHFKPWCPKGYFLKSFSLDFPRFSLYYLQINTTCIIRMYKPMKYSVVLFLIPCIHLVYCHNYFSITALTLSLPQATIIGFCKQHRSRWDGSMSRLIWIYAVWHSVFQLYI